MLPRISSALLFSLLMGGAFAATHGRLTVRATAENNVFLQDEAPLAANQTRAGLPAGASAVALTAAASLDGAWKVAPALTIELGYAPELVRYSRYPQENHTDHRFTFAATGAVRDWRYEVRGSVLVIDGSAESPVFNRLGGTPCIGGEPVRARRAQDLGRLNASATRTLPGGFVRGVAATYRQDFHTRQRPTPGYANYVDRSETAGGIDAGWTFRPGWALVAGGRGGHQQQATLLGNPLNYSNTLVRGLAGLEGAVGKTWKVGFLAGPDARRYTTAAAPTFARHRHTSFAEGAVTWMPAAADTIALTGKRYLWLSSGGRSAYVDLLADLSWKHRFPAGWCGLVGVNHHTGDSRAYNAATPRDDAIDSARIVVTRQLGAYTLEASWLRERGRSGIPLTPGRAYHRALASLGVTRAW